MSVFHFLKCMQGLFASESSMRFPNLHTPGRMAMQSHPWEMAQKLALLMSDPSHSRSY